MVGLENTTLVFIILSIALFFLIVRPEKEGDTYSRLKWIIGAIIYSSLMAGYSVSRVTHNRQTGLITFLTLTLMGYYMGLTGLIIGWGIIYLAWKQIPEEKKDYSIWWEKYTITK